MLTIMTVKLTALLGKLQLFDEIHTNRHCLRFVSGSSGKFLQLDKLHAMTWSAVAQTRMADSQSSEPGFKSIFATVSKIGHFRSLR